MKTWKIYHSLPEFIIGERLTWAFQEVYRRTPEEYVGDYGSDPYMPVNVASDMGFEAMLNRGGGFRVNVERDPNYDVPLPRDT